MEDGIPRVLPPLLDETGRRLTRVLDEAVAIAIAVAVDPRQRPIDVWPDVREELAIAGAFDIRARQDHEQRCRVDTAVIASERDLAEPRHLAAARLVQNLSRLGVTLFVDRVSLCGREVLEYAVRDSRIDPERLQPGDDAVATERRAEPRHASKWIRTVR